MKKTIFILLLLAITSCTTSTNETLQSINGYWNIDTVEMEDGSDREFPFSNHMDHFAISETSGVKNRVSPTYDGKFINYGSPVPFKWKDRDGKLFLMFNDGESKYEQEVVEANAETMTLLHENGTRYLYKRYSNEEQ